MVLVVMSYEVTGSSFLSFVLCSHLCPLRMFTYCVHYHRYGCISCLWWLETAKVYFSLRLARWSTNFVIVFYIVVVVSMSTTQID